MSALRRHVLRLTQKATIGRHAHSPVRCPANWRPFLRYPRLIGYSDGSARTAPDVSGRRRHDFRRAGQTSSPYFLRWLGQFVQTAAERDAADPRFSDSGRFHWPEQCVPYRRPQYRTSNRRRSSRDRRQRSDRLLHSVPTACDRSAVGGSPRSAMVVEHMSNIGRRDAPKRTPHFLPGLGARLMLDGLGTREGYGCPLSQYLLSDALGLSAVHVN